MGGKFGDFIHSLVFCDYLHKFFSTKVDIRIENVEDVFFKGPLETRNDFHSLIMKQPYVNSFEVYTGEPVDVHLYKFRHSPLLYKAGWTDIYVKTFLGLTVRLKDNVSLVADKLEEYKDTVVIHQRPDKVNKDAYSVYEKVIDSHECIFLTQEKDWYEQFPMKDKVKMVIPTSGENLVSILNSCKYYVGNQTAFTAISHILNTPRLIECVGHWPDTNHYTGDIQYYSNMSYFVSETENYISPLSILYE